MWRVPEARSWSIAVAALALACAVSGCRSDAESEVLATTRDSSGIRIVQVPDVAALPDVQAFEPQPFLVLGGLRDNLREEFSPQHHPFLAGVMLSDGTFVVNDASSLKFFDSTGALLRVAGRSGSGPGEFQAIREVCLMPGDTLVAIEYSAPRLSMFASDGQFFRSLQTLGHAGPQPCLTDGTMLVSKGLSAGEEGYPGSRLVRMDTNGAEVLALGVLPRSEYGLIFREVKAVASGNRHVIADGLWYELRVHGADGQLLTIVRSDKGPRAVTNEVWDEIVELTVPNDVAGPERSAQVATLRNGPRPTHFPAYEEVMSGPTGQLWVQDYHYPDDPAAGRRWTVFAPDGMPLGRVHLTDDTGQLAAVGEEFVVLRRRDDNGATELRLHRLTLAR